MRRETTDGLRENVWRDRGQATVEPEYYPTYAEIDQMKCELDKFRLNLKPVFPLQAVLLAKLDEILRLLKER